MGLMKNFPFSISRNNAASETCAGLDKLYKEFYPIARDMALHHTNDPHAAEDIVQEIFLQLLEQRKNLETIRNFKSYLFIAVRNQFLKTVQKKRYYVYQNMEAFAFTAARTHASDELYFRETLRCFSELLDSMCPKTREIFYLKRIAGVDP